MYNKVAKQTTLVLHCTVLFCFIFLYQGGAWGDNKSQQNTWNQQKGPSNVGSWNQNRAATAGKIILFCSTV